MRRARSPIAIAGICLFSVFVESAGAGDELDLGAYHGKVVVLDFWASWCVPCRRSFPWLDSMQAKYENDGLVVIGINEDSDSGAAAAFLEEFPVRFRIVGDAGGRLATRYDLMAMPSSYVFDRDGEYVVHHLGFKTASLDDYEHLLRKTLGLPPAPADSAAGRPE